MLRQFFEVSMENLFRSLFKSFLAIFTASLMVGCNGSSDGQSGSPSAARAVVHSSFSLRSWSGYANGTTYSVFQVGPAKYVISYSKSGNQLGYIVHDESEGSKSIDFSPPKTKSSVSVVIQVLQGGDLSVLVGTSEDASQFVAKPVSIESPSAVKNISGNWSATVLDKAVAINVDEKTGVISGSVDGCVLTGSLEDANAAGSLAGTGEVGFKDETCAIRQGKISEINLLLVSGVLLVYSKENSPSVFFMIGAPGEAQEKGRARAHAYANSGCYQWVAQCRAKCSATALPSGDHGFRFWNCVNACAAVNGC